MDTLMMPQAQGYSSFASKLLNSGFNSSSMRTCEVLRKDEWIKVDEKLIEVSRQRLQIVNDLMTRGLTTPVANAMGTTRLEWEEVSDMSPADIDMAGVSQGERDRVLFGLKGLPLPIIHKDFNINVRALESSRRTGQSLDTTQMGLATKLVAETIEKLVFVGSSLTVSGDSIPGLTTAPNRNTGSLTGDWSDAGAVTGTQIINDVLAMTEALIGDNMYGPYGLYVPNNYGNRFGDDYKANSDKTIQQRLMEIPQIELIRPVSAIPANTVILVQLTSDVIEMIDGIQPQAMQWETQGGMVLNFKVLAIMIPRIRNDFTNQSGIAHFTV